jgi:O-antigen ligase
MIAPVDEYGFWPMGSNPARKWTRLFLLVQIWLIGSFILHVGLGFEYPFMVSAGILVVSILGLLHFRAPIWIVFWGVLLSVLPNLGFASVRLLDLVLLGLMVSVLFALLTDMRPESKLRRIDAYILLYLSIIFVSGLISGDVLNFHLKSVVYGFLVFFATRSYLGSERKHGKALLLLAACGTLVVLQMAISFMQYHPHLIVTSFARTQADVSWGGTNYLAAILVLLLPLVISQFFLAQRRTVKGLALGLVGAMILAVFWTVSRTGVLCLSLIFLMLLFGLGRKKAWMLLAGLPIAFLVLSPYLGKVTERFSYRDVGSYMSTLDRYDLWKKSWEIFEENPVLGVGMGNAEMVTVLGHRSTNPHNIVFKSLAETGIVGFLLLLLIFMELFRTLFRLRRAIKTTQTGRIMFIGFLITLSVSVFNRMLEVTGDRYEILFWFIMGLLFVTAEQAVKDISFDAASAKDRGGA